MGWLRRHKGKLLLAVALLGVGGFVLARQLAPSAVRGVPVQRADVVASVLVSGRVLPPAEVDLTSRVEALVREVPAREGQEVEAGEVLATLDATELEAEVARARATLARAQAASGRSRRIAPQVAEQQLSTAEVQLREAQRTLEQAETLVSAGVWPEDRLAAAEAAVSRAESAQRSARLELVAARGADRRAADATVEEAVAALSLAEQRLAQTVVRAPIAGVILERRVDAGDVARPGNVLFRLAAEGPPILSVEPDERHLSQLALGQRAHVESDAYRDQPFDAEVTFIAPSVDPERGTVEVRLLPRDEVAFLLPNMTVSVEIEVDRAVSALVIPRGVVFDAATDAPWVLVVEDGRLARRSLALGLRGDEQVQVLEGLDEDDAVVARDDPTLEVGARVELSEPTGEDASSAEAAP